MLIMHIICNVLISTIALIYIRRFT